MKQTFLLFFAAALLPLHVALADPSAPTPDSATPTEPSVVRVGVAGSAPFVTGTDAEPDGLAVEVWRAAAEPLGLQSRYLTYPSVDSLIEALEHDAIDVAVGPVSITRTRAEVVAFTQPWMQAGIGIATPPSVGMGSVFAHLFSRAVLLGVGLLVFVLIVVGTLLWFVERKHNEAFSSSPLPGIGDGMWLALVTMTTVGYGDIAPLTRAGRVITGVWMLVAMVTASSLTAGIATLLTLSQLGTTDITHPRDLAGRQVGAVQGTSPVRFAKRHRGRVVPFSTLADALAAAEAGDVEAVLHDHPILAHSLHEPNAPDLLLLEGSWEQTGYGFAFSLDDPLRHKVNIELLGLHETRTLSELMDEWL